MTQARTGTDVGSRVLERAKELNALLFGEFTLASGATSSYYFDGRLLTLDPEGASLAANALLPAIRASGAEAVGGPAVGAVSLVTSLAMLSGQDSGRRMPGFFVRAEAKGHGTGKRLEGPVPDGVPVAIVDDACSTAGSLYVAIRAAEEEGHRVVLVACILDRNSGGGDKLRGEGYNFHAVLAGDAEGNVSVVS
jgi:orotate phosphoribosyltransferase